MPASTIRWTELPALERQVLLMRCYRNMTQDQLAGRLGVSQPQVSRLLSQAPADLRLRLPGLV